MPEGVAAKKLKTKHTNAKVEERLAALEEEQSSVGNRVDSLEYRVEQGEAYRFLRVEKSAALEALWVAVEANTVERKSLRSLAAEKLLAEVRAAFLLPDTAEAEPGAEEKRRELEAKLQEKSLAASNGRRGFPEEAERARALDCVHSLLPRQLQWVKPQLRDGARIHGTFQLVLEHGEDSRRITAMVKQIINWTLYVSDVVWLYPDKGPKERAVLRNKGKGKGKDKGKGKGKGKAKGRGGS
jgi:hypothetical protein